MRARTSTSSRRAPHRKERGKACHLKVVVDPPPLCADRAGSWWMRDGRTRSRFSPVLRCVGTPSSMRMGFARSSTGVALGMLRTPPPPRRPRRPVPTDLMGRCFNCLATDHVAARCTQPSRCLRCEQVGHEAKNCKRPRFPGPLRGRGRPTQRFVPGSDVAAAANTRLLLLRRGRLPWVVPTPVPLRFVQLRRRVAHHRWKLALGRSSLEVIPRGAHNSSPGLFRVHWSYNKLRILSPPLPWSCW